MIRVFLNDANMATLLETKLAIGGQMHGPDSKIWGPMTRAGYRYTGFMFQYESDAIAYCMKIGATLRLPSGRIIDPAMGDAVLTIDGSRTIFVNVN